MKDAIFEFIRGHVYALFGVLCIVAIGVIFMFSRTPTAHIIQPQDIIYAPTTTVVITTTKPLVIEERTIMVHIVGEVVNSRVFELPYGSRVNDVLEMAGGATIYADLSRINLAAFLRDAMQVIVPAFGEEITDLLIENAPVEPPMRHVNTLININTASFTELQTLPRVGPVMAQRIIDFRESHGNFASVDELINVTGIGTATLDGLRNMVTV